MSSHIKGIATGTGISDWLLKDCVHGLIWNICMYVCAAWPANWQTMSVCIDKTF